MNEQVSSPNTSLTVQVTVVVCPAGKLDPDAGVHITLGSAAPVTVGGS